MVKSIQNINGWKNATFEEVLEGFGTGMTPYRKNSDYWKGDIPWVTSGELNYNRIFSTNEHVTKAALNETSLKLLQPNTLLIAITGLEATGTRGSCAILGIQATTNQSCLYLLPKNETDIKYVYYYYQFVGDYLGLNYAQGTKQQSFTGKIVRKLPIIIPKEKKEQTAIARSLSDMDDLIATTKKLIAKKEAIKQGLMQELLTGRVRLRSATSQPFRGEWENKKLNEVLTFGSGTDYKHLSEGNIPVYGTGGIMAYVEEYLYEGESVGIGRKGTINKPVYLTGKFWTVDTLFYTHSFKGVLPKFIFYSFLLIDWTYYNEASGVPSLNKNTIGNVIIQVPSMKEQKQIVEILSDVEGEITHLSQRLEKLIYLKQGMMQELLTGRIRLVQLERSYAIEEESLPIAAEPFEEMNWLDGDNLEKEAAILAMLVAKSDIALGRFRYQKLMYLFHRKTDNAISGWLNKAAGPYNHDLRYGGVEDFVVRQDWCKDISNDNEHPRYQQGANNTEAKQQYVEYYSQTTLNWLKKHFFFKTDDELELLATADKAKLSRTRNRLSTDWMGVKEYIAQEPEWQDKLKKGHFSDDNLQSAVVQLESLFDYE